MNANEEPRNAGTFPFARNWNSSVPRPANRSVADTDRPVSAGTSTVAPNMANICCRPNTPIFGTPSGRASYTASGLSLAPMVGTGRSLLIGKTPLASLSPRAAPPPDGERAQTFGIMLQERPAGRGNEGKRLAFPSEGVRGAPHLARGMADAIRPAARRTPAARATGRTASGQHGAPPGDVGRRDRCAHPLSHSSFISGSPSPSSRWSPRRRWPARAR